MKKYQKNGLTTALMSIFVMGIFGFPGFVSAQTFNYIPPSFNPAPRYTPTYTPSSPYYYPSSGNYYPVASTLSVSCAATPVSAKIGEQIQWFSSVTGGSGNYQYFWSGTDGLTGYSSSILRVYATAGDKFATVTVTSEGQSITVGCTGGVRIGNGTTMQTGALTTGFGASCYATKERIAPGESITWRGIIVGAPGTTTAYSWSGTDNLAGTESIATKTYTAEGTKEAILTVASGDQRIVTSCTNAVTVAPKTATPPVATPQPTTSSLQALCTADRREATVGDAVIWSATAIGGKKTYSYAWAGDEKLGGNAPTTSIAYAYPGPKNATVIVSSNGTTITRQCLGDVLITPSNSRGLTAGVGWTGADVFSSIIGFLALIFAILAILCCLSRRREARNTQRGTWNMEHKNGTLNAQHAAHNNRNGTQITQHTARNTEQKNGTSIQPPPNLPRQDELEQED